LKVGAVDIRKQWRECLEAPVELKSFTFARLSLLPALQTPSDNADCDVTEFFLSVYAEFASHYLDVLSVGRPFPEPNEQKPEDLGYPIWTSSGSFRLGPVRMLWMRRLFRQW
jgi:hypothetical protein